MKYESLSGWCQGYPLFEKGRYLLPAQVFISQSEEKISRRAEFGWLSEKKSKSMISVVIRLYGSSPAVCYSGLCLPCFSFMRDKVR
jgi:hypothetical protein